MSKTATFLADGFEEIEGLTVVDILRRAGVENTTVSIMGRREIHGSHQITVMADALLEEMDFADYDMLILPGGTRGKENLEACDALMHLLDTFYAEGKWVCAICASPSIFGHRGYLKGRKACVYPGFESELTGAEVMMTEAVIDGNVITGAGMGCSTAFALAIVEAYMGADMAETLAERVIYGKRPVR